MTRESARVAHHHTPDSQPPSRYLIMHHFWEIHELVRILSKDLEERCGASASAIALACCSKRLADVVLDQLWEHLTGLVWLMRCLPRDTWESRNGEFVITTRSGPRASGAYWSTGLLTLPLHPGMDAILDLRSENTFSSCV